MYPPSEPHSQWYVMRDLKRPNARIRAYRQLSDAGFTVFTPMVTRVSDRNGKRIRETVPFISDLLFVFSTRMDLDPVVDRIDTLQYRFVKGGGYCEPLVVRGVEMERFMAAVDSANKPRYFRPSEIDAKMLGAEVRVICDGSLNGFQGRLLKIKGSGKKRVLIELPGLLVAAVEVEPDFIQLV